jgi:hypothetical protein
MANARTRAERPLPQAQRVALVGGDAEFEMQRVLREPVRDFLRPFDRETPRRIQEILYQ